MTIARSVARAVASPVARAVGSGIDGIAFGPELLTFNSEFDNAVWVKTASASVIANDAVAPDSTTTADAISVSAANNWVGYNPPITFTAGRTYRFAVWLKRKTGSGNVQINANPYNDDPWTTVGVTASWQRFFVDYTPPITRNPAQAPGILLVTSGDAVHAWGASLKEIL